MTVAQTAEVLDRLRPGWPYKIDMERLNIMSCSDCIIGQLDGRWIGSGLFVEIAIALNNSDTYSLGLNADPFQTRFVNQAWRREILNRIHEDALIENLQREEEAKEAADTRELIPA